MSDAFIVRRGGGGGKLFAAIVVDYPSGSTCTCSNGSKTLRAKDTSGSFLFVIPEAGTWTVSCTDGTKTATKSVVIDTQYQTENIILNYELVLYDGSLSTSELRECTDVTGGWVRRLNSTYYSAGTMTKGTSDITISASETKLTRAETSNAIDFSDYSKLVVNVTQDTAGGTYKSHQVLIFDSPTAGADSSLGHVTITGTGPVELEIPEGYGMCYPSIMVSTEDNSTTNIIKFDKVLLR